MSRNRGRPLQHPRTAYETEGGAPASAGAPPSIRGSLARARLALGALDLALLLAAAGDVPAGLGPLAALLGGVGLLLLLLLLGLAAGVDGAFEARVVRARVAHGRCFLVRATEGRLCTIGAASLLRAAR